MDLHSLKNEGWTNTEIAEELGYHPATVAKWLRADSPPERAAAAGRHRWRRWLEMDLLRAHLGHRAPRRVGPSHRPARS
ncbi:MAG: helix-turn-helix domain-containing protein [Acidimicrobiaceae bacterium]|nr:helix-turn-helix domain-containing protein [Acidimicrobiaceae bacterium]